MKNIELLIKPTSYLCNLDCTYCFYKKTKKIYPDAKIMDEKTLERMISYFMDYSEGGRCSFCWQGGEPLLAGIDFYYKVIEFQKKYGKSGQIVSNTIQTNGILIDEKWTDFFKKYNVFIGISVDGPKQIHNFYRKYPSGKGSFNDVMEKVNLLKKANVEFNILSTIGEQTGKYPEEIFKFFVSKNLYFLQFIPAVDRKRDKIASFSITPETYGDFLCRIFDLWWNDGYPFVSIRFFDNILEILMGVEPGSCALKERCGEYLVVEHNGDIYPCDFFVNPDFKIGNIFVSNPEDVYKKLNNFGKLKENTPEKCKNCEWKFICHNGCTWFRWIKRGNVEDPDYFCSAYRKFFSYSIERFKIIASRLSSA